MRRDAWLLANLLQPWSKERLKVTDFYTPRTRSPQADEAEWARFHQLLGVPPLGSTDG